MIRNSGEKDIPSKQETDERSSSSKLWPGLRNPRIVRVSRAFGGKDRHSKVSTVRGLRDRRVRLSVPTAIQLYDLQDRLGLNQPSKVVDWLLNAAQHEIDKLPPLQMPPGNFIQFNATDPESPSNPQEGNEEENQDDDGIHGGAIESLGLLSNAIAHPNYYHWEPSMNAYASHLGIHSAQFEVPPTSIPSSQLVLCGAPGANSSMFLPYVQAGPAEQFDARQFGHAQLASSALQYRLSGGAAMRSFQYSNLAYKHQSAEDQHDN